MKENKSKLNNNMDNKTESRDSQNGNHSKKDSKPMNKKFNKRNGKDKVSKGKFPYNNSGHNTSVQGNSGMDSKINDPSWYSKGSQLVIDTCRLPFNDRLGDYLFDAAEKIKFINNKTGKEEKVSAYAFPGIVSLDIDLGIGNNVSAMDAASLAATKIFANIRKANSGKKNYEEADVMNYLLAMDQVYAMVSWGRRLYGIYKSFAFRNKYTPKRIIEACGVDYESLVNDLPGFRYKLNRIITNINNLAVPRVMDLTNRHAYMFSSVYVDRTDVRSKFYIFNPATIGFYEPTLTTSGGGIDKFPWLIDIETYEGTDGHNHKVTTRRKNTVITMDDYFTQLYYMVERIVKDEDISIIGGDILKAYDQSDLFKLVELEVDYEIEPKYDLEILQQIRNATVASYVTTKSLNIYQSGQFPIYMPTIRKDYIEKTFGSYDIYEKVWNSKLIASDSNNPDPIEVMTITRLTSLLDTRPGKGEIPHLIDGSMGPTLKPGNYFINDEFKGVPYTCGSELVLNISIFTLYKNNMMEESLGRYDIYPFYGNGLDGMTTAVYISLINGIKYFPAVAIGSVGGKIDKVVGLLFDVYNYTKISPEELGKIHEVAILSLFGITDSPVYSIVNPLKTTPTM